MPAAQGNGLAMRAGMFLAALAAGHRVHLAVLPLAAGRLDAEPPEFVRRHAGTYRVLELEPVEEARRWPTRLLSTAEGRRRAAEVYPLPAICRRPAARELEWLQRRTDGVRGIHVMRSYLAPAIEPQLDAPGHPPMTLDVDELDSRLAAALGAADEAERFARLEAEYLQRFEHLFAASEQEASAVRAASGSVPVSCVPNAVAHPAEPAPPRTAEFDLLLIGNLSYAPNVAAAEWLCRRVLPLLPGVRVALVGSAPAPEVRALAALPGVRLAADVPEVSSWYARSRVAVAPLRAGGGTRTKILEAMVHGLPVLATPQGAAGLATGAEHGVLVAGTPEAFAAGCRRLLDDPAAAARIGQAGRAAAPDREAVIEALAGRFAELFPAG